MPDNAKAGLPLVAKMERLAQHPPQVLLLEGGSEKERFDAAVWWAQSANCPALLDARSRGQNGAPCGQCPVCRQIAALERVDVLVYDGRVSNKQDEENPGPIRALRMERMRELKAINMEAPRGAGKRVAIFQGLSQTREEAMNSLLKTLEEPSAFTLFALLTPQRSQLLPTLVSRSFCLTLPWTGSDGAFEEVSQWTDALAAFLKNGSQFLEQISAKSALNADQAAQILCACQIALARGASGAAARNNIERIFAGLAQKADSCFQTSAWIEEAQAMLAATVNPARVMEAFAGKVFTLLR